MIDGEAAYLIGVIVAFGAFAVTLAWAHIHAGDRQGR